jgi:NitT/TauT family transport system substrate-binding protein
VFDYSDGGDVLLAKPHFESIADLRGKTIAGEQSALGAYTLALALKKGGLTLSDIAVENGEVDVHEQLFAKDSIDAIVTFGPARARLLAAGAKLLFSSREAPGKIIDVLVVRESIVKSHDAELRDLLDGYYAGLRKVEARDADAMALIATRMGLAVAQVGESLDGVKLLNRSESHAFLAGDRPAVAETVREVVDFMVLQNLLPETSTIELPSWPGE